MNIHVIDRGHRLPASAREHLVSLVMDGLSRFAPHIRRASIVVKDENGDKGGVDQRCRMAVRLQTWGELIVETFDDSLGRAAGRAVDRMERLLARTLERRHQRRRRASFDTSSMAS
jgi:putative sigma-54 modulation protein